MTRERLEMAGYAAIGSIVLGGTNAVLRLLIEARGGDVFMLPTVLVSMAQLAVAAYLILTWKGTLTGLFGFNRVNTLLDLSLMIGVFAIVVATIRLFEAKGQVRNVITVVLLSGTVAAGAVQIAIGRRLMTLRDDLGGLLKAYCFTKIAMGVCMVSIVFCVLAPFVAVASGVLAAMIFFNTASRVAVDGQLRRT